MKINRIIAITLLGISTLDHQLTTVLAQDTAFTYQGRLTENGVAASGIYDLRFAIYDLGAGGSLVAGPVTNSPTAVSNGLFNVSLDFGTGVFTGADRWLEIAVRTNSGSSYSTLSPRQPLSATPYSIKSLEAGSVPPGTISGAMLADGAVTAAKIAPGAVTQLGSPDGSPISAVQVNTNGLVGIGTATPQAGLHLSTGDLIFEPTILFQQSDETDPFGWDDLAGASDVAVSGNLIAVAAAGDAAVTPVVLNFPSSILRQPQLNAASGYTNLAGASAVAFSGRLLAVAANNANAVTLADLTTPAVPVKRAELRDGVGGFNELGGAVDVAFTGNLMAIAANTDDAVTLVDVTSPTSPQLRAVLKDGQFGFDFLNGASGVAFNGNLLAISAGFDNAITLVDVSNPTAPVLRTVMRDGVNGFDRLNGVGSLAWSGNLLIASAFNDDSVVLIDCSVPAAPVLRATLTDGIGGMQGLDSPVGLAVQNNLLAVTAGGTDNAVTLFDIANPALPVLRGTWRDEQSGLHFLNQPGGIVFSGSNVVVTSRGDDAFTVVSPQPQQAALASEGWVGIGTTRPAAALHVIGNVVVEGAQGVQIQTQSFAAGDRAEASGDNATALGDNSEASGDGATALGVRTRATGWFSTAMGYQSEASGFASFGAGYNCMAVGVSSFALGTWAQALHTGAFVWSDSLSRPGPVGFASTADHQFRVRADGGAEFIGGTNRPALQYSGGRTGNFNSSVGLAVNTNTIGRSAPALRVINAGGDSLDGALSVSTSGTGFIAVFGNSSAFVSDLSTNGTWRALAYNPMSDRAAKENFTPVNPQEVLDKVTALPLSRWNYKAAPGLDHIGPVAQDFHAAFGLNGDDDKHIATVDADGVALAAIQGLNEKVEVRSERAEGRIERLEKENAELKARLANLEKLIGNPGANGN
jgi:hypothetical protein